jgi:5-methylcytosine-specific restriction endonuclease McrA
VNEKDRWAVFIRDRFRCVYCGYQATWLTAWSISVAHRTPVTRGGSDVMENLQTMCTSCHRQKGERTDTEFRAELALRKRLIGF